MSDETYYDGPFSRPARYLLGKGFHPNHLTFLQLPVYTLQVIAAQLGWRWVFAGLIVLVVLLDAGDGILARVGRLQSKTGAALDSLFDTMGIAIVMWGAAKFFPEATTPLMLLFFANIVLFLQNALLDEKMIAYLRGPILLAVIVPETLWAGILVPAITTGVLLVIRIPATLRALARHVPV